MFTRPYGLSRQRRKACSTVIRAMSFHASSRTERPVARNGCYLRRVRSVRSESALGTTEHTGDRAATQQRYEGSMRRKEPPAMGRTLPTLKRAWPKDGPLAAICVQSVDVQCVLQFTLIHAAGCVLHRRTSRVIHRLKLFSFLQIHKLDRAPTSEGCRQRNDRSSLSFQPQVSYAIGNEKKARGAASS